MSIYATCTDCDWQVEADDHTDAHLASAHHWDAAHAPTWCGFCDIPGPMSKRKDHDECLEYAITGDTTALDEGANR